MVTEFLMPQSSSTQMVYLASRYTQGGRTVYSLTLSPFELISIIPRPDPDRPITMGSSNRGIRKKHAVDFATYFRSHSEWVIPGLILRAAGTLDFQMVSEHDGVQFGALVVTRIQASGINILDGQHRTLGFHIASEEMARELDDAHSQLAKAQRNDPGGGAVRDAHKLIETLNAQLRRFGTERVSAQLYVEADPQAYRQMFADISDNALGITASVRVRFDQRSVVNRALPMVLEHPLFAGRTELEANSPSRTSENLISVKQLAELIRASHVGFIGRFGKKVEASTTEKAVADTAMKFADALIEAFPPLKMVSLGQLASTDLRKTSLLGSAAFLRILAGVYHELQDPAKHGWSRGDVIEYFKRLAPHVSSDGSPVYPGSIWIDRTPDNAFPMGALAPGGRRQDTHAAYGSVLAWALDREAFLDEAPAPRPEVPAELTEDDYLLAKEEAAAARERRNS